MTCLDCAPDCATRSRHEHPHAGRLSFEYTVLRITGERFATMNLTAYVPRPATDTCARLEALLREVVAA